MQDTHDITNAVRGALHGATRDLHAQFRGVFGEATIESLLLSQLPGPGRHRDGA